MPTPDDVRCGLEELPDTLKDAYGEIYKRILDQNGSAPRLALGAFRWNGYEGVARLLTGGGADVSGADKDGWTPLHIAAQIGREAVAQLLMCYGADVSAADKDGWTPLHGAAENGHGMVAQQLIDEGADVLAANKYGLTPLHVAEMNKQEAVAQLLMCSGGDVSAADKDGSTPTARCGEERARSGGPAAHRWGRWCLGRQ